MKRKNIHSVLHNFAHSLQSFDYTRSKIVVFHILVDHYVATGKNKITFDFINEKIYPEELNNDNSKTLFNDYHNWLPELAKSQNTDVSILEELTIQIAIDFSNFKIPRDMVDVVELETKTKVHYSIHGEPQRQITLTSVDIYGKKLLPHQMINEFWGESDSVEKSPKEMPKNKLLDEIGSELASIFLGNISTKIGWAIVSLIIGVLVLTRPFILASGATQQKSFHHYFLGSSLIVVAILLTNSWLKENQSSKKRNKK